MAARLGAYDIVFFFFFQAEDGIRDVAVTGVQTCALPISRRAFFPSASGRPSPRSRRGCSRRRCAPPRATRPSPPDRKSTRLNSSHGYISYAVFCLKKKKKNV